jgi:hypothetical protein
MVEVRIEDQVLRQASEEGIDEFVGTFIRAIYDAIGGELTAESMAKLNSDQITLLGFHILHEEVMDGGFVQLIHNGYGPFFFRNPFAKAMRAWGLRDLSKLINKAHDLYKKYHEEIEAECTDEEFMALFERFGAFDDCDDEFVENEEEWTQMIAHYIDEHIDRFATVV